MPDVAGAGVVLGTEVVGDVVMGGRVVVGRIVVGAVVVVGEGAVVAGGLAGVALWVLLLEPQAGRPNATAVSASTASLPLETGPPRRPAPGLGTLGFQHTRPAGGGVISPVQPGPDAGLSDPTIGASKVEAANLAKSRTPEP